MRLHESGEMYLETIYVLSKQIGDVRSLDVAEYMNFSKPSVSRAVRLLKEGEFITVDKDGYITLTDAGREIAEKSTNATLCLQIFSQDLESMRKQQQMMHAKWSMTSATQYLRQSKIM